MPLPSTPQSSHHPESPQHPPPTPIEHPDPRTLICAFCQYDLADQPSQYIEQYHVRVVQCPECGRHQPSNQRAETNAARRFKVAVTNALWLLLIICSTLGTSIAIVAMAQSTAYAASQPAADHIRKAWEAAYTDTSGQFYNPNGWSWNIDASWWDTTGHATLLAQSPSPLHPDWIVLTDWFWFLLIAPISAGMLRAVLHGSHAVTRAVTLAFTLGLAALFLFTYLAVANAKYLGQYYHADSMAVDAIGQPIAWMTFLIGSASILGVYATLPRLMPRLRTLFPSSKRHAHPDQPSAQAEGLGVFNLHTPPARKRRYSPSPFST